MTTIADLYKHYETLDAAKDKASQHEMEYRAIMNGAKSGPNEKRLASQFIVKFQKYFPQLLDEALAVLMELCENTDVTIRRQALKDIETLCRDHPDICQKTSDILTQLLQADDATELTLVHKCLMTALRSNAKGTLDGLFQQIIEGEELVRERAINFLSTKLKLLIAEDVLPKDFEEFLLQHCRKVLEDVSGSEFVIIIHLLESMPSMQTLLGRQQLLDLVTEQAELTEVFQANDPDCVERLIQCIKEAMPLFSKNVHSGKFVEYICLHVLPLYNVMAEENLLELLKQLAEMVIHCGELGESVSKCTTSVFDRLIQYMPLPKSEEAGKEIEEDAPKLQFTYVECLMFTFHQLGRKCPEFLTADANVERLKDFRLRLQYFARGVQMYIKSLRSSLQGKSEAELQSEENRIKTLALKTTNNINSLIKDLFYNPPAYKAVITLSFKTPVKAAPSTAGQKRRPGFTPITFGEDGDTKKKASRDDRKMYAPPGGKFSMRAGQFPSNQGYPPRGRGGYGGRGFRRW